MGIGIYVHPMPERQKEAYLQLLETCGLRDEGDADIIALMTEGDALVACGALAGHTVKQLAVSPDAEGQGASDGSRPFRSDKRSVRDRHAAALSVHQTRESAHVQLHGILSGSRNQRRGPA